MQLESPRRVCAGGESDFLITAQHHPRARRRIAADDQTGALTHDGADPRGRRPASVLRGFLSPGTFNGRCAPRQHHSDADPCSDNPTFHPDPCSDMPVSLR